MQDARVRGALLFICLACLLGSGWVLLHGRQAAPPPIVFSATPSAGVNPIKPQDAPAAEASVSPAAAPRPARMYVDVAGAVRRPSLYVLPKGSRVMQALLAAGGPAADADIDAVNLAEPVTDGEKVFVPKRGTAPPPVAASAASSSVVPVTGARSAAAPGPVGKAGKGSSAGRSSSRGAGGHSTKISVDSGEQIGLNSATLEELERLPGVGPSMAAKILAYRQQSGGFAKIDDLSLVPGIGPKKLAKLTPFVTLN